jgi:hypothetical protein
MLTPLLQFSISVAVMADRTGWGQLLVGSIFSCRVDVFARVDDRPERDLAGTT